MEHYAKTIAKLYEKRTQRYYQGNMDMIIDCDEGVLVIEAKGLNDNMCCLEDGK